MTQRSTMSGLALALAFLVVPASADAAEGFARAAGILRAGPSSDYPVVARVSRGDDLEVWGCLNRSTWCDVSVDGDRGWLPGSRIGFLRDGRRQNLSGDMALFGLTILTFGQDTYWGEHYRDRRWVNDRRWNRGHDRLPPGGQPPPDRRHPIVSPPGSHGAHGPIQRVTPAPGKTDRNVVRPARPAPDAPPKRSVTPRDRPNAPAHAVAPRRPPVAPNQPAPNRAGPPVRLPPPAGG